MLFFRIRYLHISKAGKINIQICEDVFVGHIFGTTIIKVDLAFTCEASID